MGMGWTNASVSWCPASHPVGSLFISVTAVLDGSKNTDTISPRGSTMNLSISLSKATGIPWAHL